MKKGKYRSVDKYLNKNNSSSKNGFFYKFFIRLFTCIIIILLGLIFVKNDPELSNKLSKSLNKYDINLAQVNSWYKKHFGDILPFQNVVKNNTKLVFNENLVYSNTVEYKNGVKLKVDNNYLVPIIKSGIVVFAGNKDGYGNTVIVEQVDGVDVWYGNVNNLNVSLYDYVNKGEFLGEANKYLYMIFQKDGKYISYKDYLK